MGAQRCGPAPKPDQPGSAELLWVWVGGYGAAGLQLRTDVLKVLLATISGQLRASRRPQMRF